MYIQLAAFATGISTRSLSFCLFAVLAAAQSPENLRFDPRIPYSAFIREDLFAGFLRGENERFLRGERNLEILLAERPQNRPGLIAWKGGIAFKRAVDAFEAKRTDEFEREYRRAVDLYAEAARLAPNDVGVMAITGAGFAMFADRLPEGDRNNAWEASYIAYRGLWQVQGTDAEELPVHFKGELLAGMAQSAQRSGRAAESAKFVEKIIKTMPGTPYATVAKKWVDMPAEVGKMRLVCQTCHDRGQLSTRGQISPDGVK